MSAPALSFAAAVIRLPDPRPSVVRWVSAVTALLLAVGLAAVAGFPTGDPSAEAVVPSGARLAARAAVADVHVLLTVDAGDLVVRIAFEGEKGWHGVAADPVPGRTAAAWTATAGNGSVPALSAAYGRVEADRVVVHWTDGTRASAVPARDGAYVVARPGRVLVDRVVALDAAGMPVLEVTDL